MVIIQNQIKYFLALKPLGSSHTNLCLLPIVDLNVDTYDKVEYNIIQSKILERVLYISRFGLMPGRNLVVGPT